LNFFGVILRIGSKSGIRSVKLQTPALESLKSQKAHTKMLKAEVFMNPRTNEAWSGDVPIRKYAWTPILERAGVRYRSPYHSRHTYACLMLTAGENPAWIARQMGHRDWGMIHKVYARWMPSENLNAGEKFEQLWQDKKTSCEKMISIDEYP